VKEPIAPERGQVDVIATVVIIVADGNAETVNRTKLLYE
jgi:hypothetical protein